MTDRPWIPVTEQLPESGVVVETKIHDHNGCRNEQRLKRDRSPSKLWFFEDGSMYVYYEPTHWRETP